MKRIAEIAIIATLCMPSQGSAEEVLECTDTDGNGFYRDDQGNSERSGFRLTRFTVKVFSETEGKLEINKLTERGMFLSVAEPNATLREIHWQDEAYPFPYLCAKSDVRETQYCYAPYGRFRARSIIFGKKSFTRMDPFGMPLGKDTPRIIVYYGACSKM